MSENPVKFRGLWAGWRNSSWPWLVVFIILFVLLLSGCSKSKFDLDLVDGTLTSERWNTDLDIGRIEYIEKVNGDIHIIVTSYKLAQTELPLHMMELAAALYGGGVLNVAPVVDKVLP